MNTEISTPIKIFAAVGGILILGLLGMTMLKGGGSSPSSSPVTTPIVNHPAAAATTPAASPTTPAAKTPSPAAKSAAKPATKPTATTPAHAANKPAAKTAPATSTTATKPAAHAAAPSASKTPAAAAKTKTKAKAKHKAAPAVAADGLPTPLDVLLHIHRVVVVAVWDPEVPTDKLLVSEAKAGAADAHAGFLAVSVLNEKVAAPLTAAAGGGSLLPSPGLLIYKQPAMLMNVLTGFVDRAAVAEAVSNAVTATSPAPGTPSTPATSTAPSQSASTPTTTTP